MLDETNSYEWEEVFKKASYPEPAVPHYSGSTSPFSKEDIETVYAVEKVSEGDTVYLRGFFRLQDKRYVVIRGCYSWGPQEAHVWADSWVGATLGEALNASIEESEMEGLMEKARQYFHELLARKKNSN
jgi:hypothetical protein